MYNFHSRDLLSVLFLILIFTGFCGSSTEILKQSRDLTPVKIKIEEEKPDLLLSENGSAKVKLVIPANFATDYYQDIADMVKEYLDKATGAEFEIVKGDITEGKGIFIGPCSDKTVQEAFQVLQKAPLETIEIRSFDRGIMIMGNDQPGDLGVYKEKIHTWHKKYSKGTLFAAVDFLERIVGCRFYFAGKLGTAIPDYSKTNFAIPYLSYRDSPVFPHRLSSYHGYASADNKEAQTSNKPVRMRWGLTTRLGDTQNQALSHTDQNWNQLFAKDHPEYFALRKDGSRMIQDGHAGTQRCYTNEAGLKAHIDAIRSFYKDGSMEQAFGARYCRPDKNYIRWWPNDGFHGCYCKNCQKLMDPKAPFNRQISRLIWDYVQRFATEVKKNWPDKKVLVAAYSDSRMIPKGMKLPDNVVVVPALPGTGFSIAYMKEPKYWDLAMKEYKEMKDSGVNMAWIWAHYPHRPRISSNAYAPYPAPHVLSRYVKFCQGKYSGFYLNGHQTTVLAFDNIMVYLFHKMLWNPDINVDNVLEEYCKRMFGPASGSMLKYWRLLGDRWENTRWQNPPDFETPVKRFDAIISDERYFKETYPSEIRERLQALLEQALSQTKKGSIYRDRVNWMKKASAKFFDQGKYFDSWNAAEMNSLNITPTIDGKIDEWTKFPAASLVDNVTNKQVKPDTKIWFSSDDKNLYIAGQVDEPSGKFNSKGKQERDYPIWKGADIEIFICSDRPEVASAGFSQRSQFHQIIINEEGSIYDAYQKTGGRADNSVNIDFELKVNKYPKGYDFEIKIPFASLGSKAPKPGDNWPINIFRTHKGNKTSYHSWAPTRGSFHDTSRYGVLKFKRGNK